MSAEVYVKPQNTLPLQDSLHRRFFYINHKQA